MTCKPESICDICASFVFFFTSKPLVYAECHKVFSEVIISCSALYLKECFSERAHRLVKVENWNFVFIDRSVFLFKTRFGSMWKLCPANKESP